MAHERIITVLHSTIVSTRNYLRHGMSASLAVFHHRQGFYSAHWEHERGQGSGYLNIRAKTTEDAQREAEKQMELQPWHFTGAWTPTTDEED